jgi:hypothetical protein
VTEVPCFVSIARAAQQVAKSERTIRQWVMDGHVRCRRTDHQLLVCIGDVVLTERRMHRSTARFAEEKLRQHFRDRSA